MAFAIPLLLLFETIGLIATLETAFGLFLAEEVAVAAASGVRRGAAKKIGDEIDKKVLKEVVKLLPEETQETVKTYEEAHSLMSDFLKTRDPKKIIEAQRKKEEEKRIKLVMDEKLQQQEAIRQNQFKYVNLNQVAMDMTQPGKGLIVGSR